ncbi:cardiolipin synthase [Lacticaseibacillus parakribbianus]|uniref:cardiolipin synthase n=1 Tax=Lacticaseibacillus parakribbianus TaxID=2970927 RepID=UPI0021CB03E9|nr:cardiolipin synthase [Lacticaseibacillus parakribbianus]
MDWTMIKTIISALYLLNVIAAIITVFREKRDIAATWAWLLVLNFIPIAGFLFYYFFGRKLSHRQLAKVRAQPHGELGAVLKRQQELIPKAAPSDTQMEATAKNMITLFQNTDQSYVTTNNQVAIFTAGTALFTDLRQEIAAASHSVFVEFYTFYGDQLGASILAALTAKAQEGVAVRVLYDAWGSLGTKAEFFAPLRAAGGIVEPFLGIHHRLDFRLNFRNHRKIVAIDGWTGYIGGFNIGDQYVGRLKKFGAWRDTHLKVEGDAALALQQQFIRDWNATTGGTHPLDINQTHFPKVNNGLGTAMMQIVASGPQNDLAQIKLGYMKMINAARVSLDIQTPYLIPDESVLTSLRTAIHSGVRVRIMIPHMPDHAFVYRASQYYARGLAQDGAEIYFYEAGFLHAKVMVVDAAIASVGSANMDFRSFGLNFEANAFVYDHDLAAQLQDIFTADVAKSRRVTAADFAAMPRWLRFKQTFSRLISPIL